MHDPRLRILIVRLSHLGDVVHALPLLAALRAEHPHAEIAWAVQPEYSDLLRGRPELDTTLLFDRRGGLAAWINLRHDLEQFGADWSIDIQGNVKSALVALASRAPRRSGFARQDWTEPFAATSLTDAAPPIIPLTPIGVTHAMQRTHALIRHVTPSANLDATLAISNTWLPSTGPTAGEALFHAWFGAARGPFAILHLAHERDVRSWPTASFVELARNLSADHDVLVIAGPGEQTEGLEAARQLRHTPRVHCLPDQKGLPALASFLRAAAQRDTLFVGCDSGPMHLAWSSGLRVVLLAGPQDHRRTGPWPVPPHSPTHPHSHRVVRAAIQPACAPCRSRTCAHSRGPVCMSRLEPTRAADAVRSLSTQHRISNPVENATAAPRR